MGTYSYRPLYGGAFYDPEPAGGQVDRITLYKTPDRSGVPAATVGPATRTGAGRYAFTLPDLADGRYWATITFTPSQGATTAIDRTLYLDFPLDSGLVTSPESVADELGVPLPLTGEQRAALERAVRKAQADVAGYLGRPLVPRYVVLRSATPRWTDGLDDPECWPLAPQDEIAEVIGYRPLGDGTYDVDFHIGLNGSAEEPIVRYVTAHAAEAERQRPGGVGGENRRVTSVSAEGQSVSYDAAPAAGQAGSLPSIDTLSGLRRLLYRPLGRPQRAPWPYSSARYRSS
ncbi:hypothetical protein ACGFYQ_34220 [Streptomyces sp. NPDC048258]|uniref:hypothetical protein n=1 Tax=Streptomyces sp. NPDC048258 TaxID=3365527 RepID=UPI0037108E73